MKKSSILFLLLAMLTAMRSNAQLVTLSESFDGTTFVPAGWTDMLTSGSCPWTRVTSGNVGYPSVSVSPHSGAGMAYFASYNYSSGVRSMVTPAFSLSNRGSNSASVTFWMFRDGGYSSWLDKVDVYINTSTSVSSATLLGTIYRSSSQSPSVSSNGWYQYTFSIPSSFAGSTNYLFFQGTSDYGNSIFVDDISYTTYPSVCFGTPTPGNTITSNGLVCSTSLNFTLSAQNSTSGTGVTYQWQTSSNGTTWSNVASGGTSATYTTTQSASTYYRVAVTCSNSGNTGYSNPTRVISTSSCYCTTSNGSGCSYGDRIDNVTISTLNNNSSCNSNSGSHIDYGGSAGIPTLGLGLTYPLSVTGGDGGTEYVAAWIDYDQSGTFDAGEYISVGNYTSYSGDVTLTTNVTIPSSATQGYTKMRVRIRYGSSIGSSSACSSFGYGETEDYDVNITCVTPAPTALPATTSVCSGNNATFTSTATGLGVTYQWQVSTNSGSTWTNITNGGNYSGATTSTLTVSNVTSAISGNQYRQVAATTCSSNTGTSNASTLILNTNPVVNTQPSATTTCANSSASFTTAMTGGIITYQWQVSTNGGSTWTNISNSSPYSGATSATLNISSAPISYNNYQYRAVGSNGCFNTNSNAATLTVNPLPAITANPSNTTICPNSNATFTGAASGLSLSYQWQISTNSGSTWTNLTNTATYSGVTTTTLAITSAPTTLNGAMYRMIATSSVCAPPATTTAAILNVGNGILITQHPVYQYICDGSNATYSAAGQSTNLTFQWQESRDSGVTWTNLSNTGVYSGVTTGTLSLTGARVAMNNYRYRCALSSACVPAVYTLPAALYVATLPAIASSPASTTICDNQVAHFVVSATGTALTYQWQVNNGSGYSNISNGTMYANATTNSLTVRNTNPGMNGYTYRCVVSGFCTPSVTSSAATLNVNTTPAINTQPSNNFICPGSNATFTINAVATGISYQWQINTGAGFTNLSNNSTYSGANSAALTVAAPTTSMNNYTYRCVVTGICSPSITSASVYHFVSTPPTISAQPADKQTCNNTNTSFYIGAGAITPTGFVNYQWQLSPDNGNSWISLANSGPYSGVTTDNLKIASPDMTFNGNLYRCVVSTSCNPSATSNPASLTILMPPAIGAQPANVTICPGSRAVFAVGANGSNLNYKWQVNNGSGFVDISGSDPLYVGNTSPQLIIPRTSVPMDGNLYRCIVSGSCTPTLTSSAAALKVHNPVTIVSQTIEDTACETNEKKLGVLAKGSALLYQWQVQTSPGIFKDLVNIPPYSGTTTDSLRITQTPASLSGNIYRCMITENILCNLKFYTNDIPLYVNAAPQSTPAQVITPFFSPVTFKVPNVGTSFQWQENVNNSGFADITDTIRFQGVTTPSLTILNAGFDMSGNQYRCVVDGVCKNTVASSVSKLIVDATLGVNTVSKSSGISMKVYPNPLAGAQLNISFNKTLSGVTHARVLDKLGNLVYQGIITPGQSNIASIELDALAAGVYILQVTNEDSHFNQAISFTKQ